MSRELGILGELAGIRKEREERSLEPGKKDLSPKDRQGYRKQEWVGEGTTRFVVLRDQGVFGGTWLVSSWRSFRRRRSFGKVCRLRGAVGEGLFES